MKQGDKVMIYDDPLTQEKPEGVAMLLEEYRPHEHDGLSIWIVRFLDDGYETIRTIYNKKDHEDWLKKLNK